MFGFPFKLWICTKHVCGDEQVEEVDDDVTVFIQFVVGDTTAALLTFLCLFFQET